MERIAPRLTTFLTFDGKTGLALERLEAYVYQLAEDERVAALAAALGFHDRTSASTVPGRLAEFAVHYMPGQEDTTDTSTPRRRAIRGADVVAAHIAGDLDESHRNRIDVRIWGSREEAHCSVEMYSFAYDEPSLTQVASTSWTQWADVDEPQLPYSEAQERAQLLKLVAADPTVFDYMRDDLEDGDEDEDDGGYRAVESTCSLQGTGGHAQLTLQLFEVPPPDVTVRVEMDYDCTPYIKMTGTAVDIWIERRNPNLVLFAPTIDNSSQ